MSFSGLDGSGKTTQIDRLLESLEDCGLRVRLLRFWDHIAVLGRIREAMSHTLFKSEKGIGSPEKPVQRRDKNVRSWYMTAARLFLYALDAIQLTMVVARMSSRKEDVVVFDRYLYDEIANLDLGNSVLRGYVRLLLRLIPRPDVAFLLDAVPSQARARKPEYPLDFLHCNRVSYLDLAALAGSITIVPPRAACEITRIVKRNVLEALPHQQPQRETAVLHSQAAITNTITNR